MKILIADDEVLVRKGILTCIKWENLGIESVLEASNGEVALKLIIEHDVDILLTDIKMPKMDGLELIEQLKIRKPDTVSIVLSCLNDMDSVRRALKFGGALDYIPKLSMTTDELELVLKKAITYIKKEHLKKNEYPQLPSFFSIDQEERLSQAIEIGTMNSIMKEIQDILNGVPKLKKQWNQSPEWGAIYGVYLSLARKYQLTTSEYLDSYSYINKLIQNKETVQEVGEELIRLAIELQEGITLEKRKRYDDNIKKAIEYIHKNYSANMKIRDVADYIGMSEGYFSKYFKKTMKMNYNDYLNRYRIDAAKHMLENRKMSIQEISDKVGYSNCSYFVQTFKDIIGVTPKQYQKNLEK